LLSLLRAVVHPDGGRSVGAEDEDSQMLSHWKTMARNDTNSGNVFYRNPGKCPGLRAPTYRSCRLGHFMRCVVFSSDRPGHHLLDLWDTQDEGELTDNEAPARRSYHPQTGVQSGGSIDIWSIGATVVIMIPDNDAVWNIVMRENISALLPSQWNPGPESSRADVAI
jgi:hypothetical protein